MKWGMGIFIFVWVLAGPVLSQEKSKQDSAASKEKAEEKAGKAAKPDKAVKPAAKKAPAPAAAKPVKVVEPKSPDTPEARVGAKAPAIWLKDSNGLYQELAARQGSPVLLFFFRSDCRLCKSLMRRVVDFHVKYGHEVEVLMVALLEEQDGRARLDDYLAKIRPSFPVLVDADEEVAANYIIKGDLITLPTFFFLDPEGVITAKTHRPTRPLASYLDML